MTHVTLLQYDIMKQLVILAIGLILVAEDDKHSFSGVGNLYPMVLAVLSMFPLIMIVYASGVRMLVVTNPHRKPFCGFTRGYVWVIVTNVVIIGLYVVDHHV